MVCAYALASVVHIVIIDVDILCLVASHYLSYRQALKQRSWA